MSKAKAEFRPFDEEESERREWAAFVAMHARHYAAAFRELETEREREAFRRGFVLAAKRIGDWHESAVMEVIAKAESKETTE